MSVALCGSFLLECLTGTHDLSTDTIKAALFSEDASFDFDTTAYAATNEIANGDGYTTGGATLTLSSGYPQLVSDKAAVRFEDQVWTFTASRSVRWALIYNSSKSNRAILSIDFGNTRNVNGVFTLKFPLTAPSPITLATAVVR